MIVVDSCGARRRKPVCAKKRPKRSKSRFCKGSKRKKCAKPGPVIKNAFINFLRDFRKKRCGKSMPEISKEAAKRWKCMSICKRSKYIKQACKIGSCARKPKRRKRTMASKCAKKRRPRRKASSCAKKRRPRRRKIC